ncbi:MAG: NDP-sugar synthase [Chloroflexota bacterium]|nr:NDP-sugar synthase [Dehalococcoidia bacterium]MDW8254256.1 NDP-sugar synthase [Chloroflexota bacterium]
MTVPAIVLAAGEGTRLRPFTLDRPKPMVPLAGRPALEWLLRWLRWHGVQEVYINLYAHPSAIRGYFGDGAALGLRIVYSEERQLLGTAGGAAQFRDRLAGTVLVCYGDVLSDLDLSSLLRRHLERRAAATLALYRVPDPWTRGVVDLAPDGRVIAFREKPPRDQCPPSALVNAGIFALDAGVLRSVPDDRPSDFGHDLFPALLAAGAPLYGWEADAYVLDFGTLELYRQAEEDVRAGRVRLY